MDIRRLRTENFRNLEEIELEPASGVNIIYGDNAQGKTNLVEAIWLLTGAKSFRGARDGELVRFGQARARVEAWFWKEGREQTACLQWAEKKEAWRNDIAAPPPSGLAGHFCAVIFAPSHLSLIQAGPSERRRFLDAGLCQLSPQYLALLTDYRRTLLQRNSLLKDISYSATLLDTLDVWDDRLAALSALIYGQRERYVNRLEEQAAAVYQGLTAGAEAFSARYEAGPPERMPNAEARAWYHAALRQARPEDIRLGTTTIGPHRDDLALFVNGAPLRVYGSQGQQRSGVLALKLAEAALLRSLLGEDPVILLDDVMSELDQHRKDYLLNHLGGSQVFITCCDRAYLDQLRDGKSFRVERGAVHHAEAAILNRTE